MTGLSDHLSWRFGGPLSSLPPAVAWTILAAAGLGGAAWIILSYRRTLVELRPARRNALIAVRLLLFSIVILLLAGPVRVEPAHLPDDAAKAARPLAVLSDRSASMLLPDNRRESRADNAQRRWRTFAPAAEQAFPDIRAFSFATELSAAGGPAASGDETHLYSALQRVLASAPAGGWGGVVTLTDGLDTSGIDGSEPVVTEALKAGTPLYFVPGRNRYAGAPYLHLRDWTAPAQLAPRSSFRLEVTLDSFQAEPRSIPVRLRVGDQWRPAETLALGGGHRMMLWGAEITADAPGNLPIEVQFGEGEAAVRAHADIAVRASENTRILYHQGALDWGYKFLADILRRDPTFVLTPILRLAPERGDPTRAGAIGRPLPSDRNGYASYDIVVLANTTAAQLSPAQQEALTAWVRQGGVLIFLMPDDASSQGFAGSELEKMLPVVFAPAAGANARRFSLRQSLYGGGFDEQATTLSEFTWEPAAARIFGQGEISSPRFLNYARVLRAKPGAEVLARHPTAAAPAGGDPGHAILLAVQRYGQGQSAVLTSDALWRWKLNQPSTDRSAEKFWQHLFAWLGRERAGGLRFDRAPLTVSRGQEIAFRLAGAGAPAARVSAQSGATTIALPAGETKDEATQLVRWTPPAVGEWQLVAADAAGHEARHWLQVVGSAQIGERSGAPPDEGLLARLAGRTGGSVLVEGEAPAWVDPRLATDRPEPPEVLHPLWHHFWVFIVLLGGYSIELLLRRAWRLL
ncbi:MAG TPA: hypothetical protein VG734_01575 [Lacunisphaera sp.]|nr:hypothetical protein [Lacunisphaera sp.]